MAEDRLDQICNNIKNKLNELIETLDQEHKLKVAISAHERAAADK